MKPIAHKTLYMLLDNKFYWSKAYQSLTLLARNLLWCMFAELDHIGKRGSKKRPFAYTNNRKISFTKYEWKKQGLGASGTYCKCKKPINKSWIY